MASFLGQVSDIISALTFANRQIISSNGGSKILRNYGKFEDVLFIQMQNGLAELLFMVSTSKKSGN